jgi:hypothetical protein
VETGGLERAAAWERDVHRYPVERVALRRAALQVLKPAHPYALPQESLLAMIDDLVKPPLQTFEATELLHWLGSNKMAVRTAGALDPDAPEWVITSLGKSLLASL